MVTMHNDITFFRALLADWFVRLAHESGMGVTQCSSGDDKFIFSGQAGVGLTADFLQSFPYLRFSATGEIDRARLDRTVQQAIALAKSGDLGGRIWYSASLPTADLQLATGTIIQALNGQVRISGWHRLGLDVLVEFCEEQQAGSTELFAPKTIAHVHVSAPGPCRGNVSSHVARSIVEFSGAICTFALGRPVVLPPAVFPSKPDRTAHLDKLRVDDAVPSLARRGVPLNVFSAAHCQGGIDYANRIRSALLSFDAAQQQQHDAVACILYVVAAESLTVPNTKWRDAKVTKRFTAFFEELMPEVLDRIVRMGDFERGFGIKRGQKTARKLRSELLKKIYSYRSGHVHEGLRPTYLPHGGCSDSAMVRPRFADFAEAAILSFLVSPRSSLIGHPMYADSAE